MGEKRKIKLTSPRSFHLKDSKRHQPIANLSGDGEAKIDVNLDRAKLWDKVAGESATLSPEDEQALEQNPELRKVYGGHPGSQTTGATRPVAGSLGYQATLSALPGGAGGWIRGLLRSIRQGTWASGAGGLASQLGNEDIQDQSLTGPQLEARDRTDLAYKSDNAHHDAAARTRANLDPIRNQQLFGAATGMPTAAGLLASMPRGGSIVTALPSLMKAWNARKTDLAAVPYHLGGAAGTAAAGRVLAADMDRAANVAAPTTTEPGVKPSLGQRLTQGVKNAIRPLTAPSVPRSWTGAIPEPKLLNAYPAAPTAGKNGLRMAGQAARRLGVAGLAVGAGQTLGEGLRRRFTENGQDEYADMARAQTEADAARSPLAQAEDTAKAVLGASLGSGDHLSAIAGSRGASAFVPGYKDAILQDAKASDIMAKAKNEHYGAFQQMFPDMNPAEVNALAEQASKRSADNYRLFEARGGKPAVLGKSNFEKRLDDPQDPNYSTLDDQQREAFRDLARRTGGSYAEEFVNRPASLGTVANAQQVPRYQSEHVVYPDSPAQPAAQTQQPQPQSTPESIAAREAANRAERVRQFQAPTTMPTNETESDDPFAVQATRAAATPGREDLEGNLAASAAARQRQLAAGQITRLPSQTPPIAAAPIKVPTPPIPAASAAPVGQSVLARNP